LDIGKRGFSPIDLATNRSDESGVLHRVPS
jgi:hypothetical protein